MSTPTTARAELAAAVRRVNVAFNTLPESVRDSLDLSSPDLEREIDAAILGDDRPRALVAIRAWREHHLQRFREAANA